MIYIMSNSTDIIIVDSGNVRYHQKLGFKVESTHKTIEQAETAAVVLERSRPNETSIH